jgi:GWxTD domain-containing protein
MGKIASTLLFIAIISSCGSKTKGIKGLNIAYLYQVEGHVIRANFALQRISSDSAWLYYTFHANDLLFVRDKNNGELYGSVEFNYKLLGTLNDKLPLDTGSFSLNTVRQKNQRVMGKFPVYLGNLPGRNDDAVLVVATRDVNRNFKMVSFVKVQNTHEEQGQNWRVYKGEKELLSPFSQVGDTIFVRHRSTANETLSVDYFKNTYGLALPPFSSKEVAERQNLHPDSTFTINSASPVVLSKPGIYHVRRSTDKPYGKSIYVMEGHYPLITQKNELVGPMRYITTKREYTQLIASDDPNEIKKAVDRFWLERGRSVEKSKNLISAFYGRVEKSNLLFSSYKEGWKTDRGLIFTIFGPPNIVTPTNEGERWVYGDESAHLSYNFNFVRISNPFTDNDYELIRDESYRYGWGMAIEAWRMGKVYNVKDIKREQDERDQQIRLRQQPYFWY